jgi:hypothetical protein
MPFNIFINLPLHATTLEQIQNINEELQPQHSTSEEITKPPEIISKEAPITSPLETKEIHQLQ